MTDSLWTARKAEADAEIAELLARAEAAESSLAALKAEVVEVAAERQKIEDALRNLMGCYDTPVSRRRFPPDDFMSEALTIARDLLAARRLITKIGG